MKQLRARIEANASRHVRALSDVALIAAMRESLPEAWAEFDARFRPLLEHYARRIGIPRWEWSVCITEVLDDEAITLAEGSRGMPQHLSAYLVRAVRNRFLEVKRAADRRQRHHLLAAESIPHGEGVLAGLVSEHTRRASDPLRVSEGSPLSSPAIERFASLLAKRLTREEALMLAWVGESVPQRQIAEWLGVTREAAKKRIARLCRRLRGLVDEVSAQLAPHERREIESLLRRAAGPRSGETDDG